MADMEIERNIPSEQKIVLFVAQKDNIETSSCLVSPPQVSFLVNGTGVPGRNNVSLTHGPQLPTDITKMIRPGTNLIQAVGYFNGNYIIAIAFMREASPSASVINDYVQPVVATLNEDSEVIVGPSRISLKCPVSCSRIKTPVKGHLCKHYECFDYDNFMEMNIRNPSWRCPCCNQPTSLIDLRIDQTMIKILSEVGGDINDVVILANGSWEVVQHGDITDQLHNMDSEFNIYSDAPTVVDLTMEEDGDSNASMRNRKVETSDGSLNHINCDSCDIEDNKPYISDHVLTVSKVSPQLPMSNNASMTTQGMSNQLTWSSASVLNGSSMPTGLDTQRVGTLESLIPNSMVGPLMTDDVRSTLNREPTARHGVSLLAFPSQNDAPQSRQVAYIRQLQEVQFRNSTAVNGTERPAVPRNISRAPQEVQAGQVPMQASNLSQGINTSSSVMNLSPFVPYRTMSGTVNTDMGMQHASRASDLFSSSQQLQYTTQGRQYIHDPAFLQAASHPAPRWVSPETLTNQQRGAGAYRASPQPPLNLLSFHQTPPMNLWTYQTAIQSTRTVARPQVPPMAAQQQATCSSAFVQGDNSMSQQNQTFVDELFPTHIARLQSRGMVPRPRVPPMPSHHQAESLMHQRTRTSIAELLSMPAPRFPQPHALPVPLQQQAPHSSTFATELSAINASRGHVGIRPRVGSTSGLSFTADGGRAQMGSTEQSWRPTGRMRGSVRGSAYEAALSYYLAQCNQTAPPISSVNDSSNINGQR